MKKLLIILLLLIPLATKAEDAITIDGEFSDWDNIITAITDSEDIAGTWYYYNSGTWQTTCPNIDPIDGTCDSFMVNQEQQLDIIDFKITNSSDYLYFYFNTAEPLGAVKNGSNSVYASRSAFGVPSSFNHWLVVGIDATSDDEADYFYAWQIAWDINGSGFPSSNPNSYLYADADTDGLFTLDEEGNPEETLLAENVLLDWENETENYEPKLEMKVDLNDFLSLTSLSANQDLNIQAVTDAALAETTSFLTYDFTSGNSSVNIPLNLRTSSLQSTSVNLVWDALAHVDQYQVQLRLEDGALVKSFYTAATSQKVDKTVLLSNNQYKFRVRAEISDDWQDWTTYYSFQTLPAKPTSLLVKKKEADQLLLKWTKPRGDISEYRINVYSIKNKLIASYTTSREQKAVKNLIPETQYKVKVKAYNEDTDSNWSKVKKPTTKPISYYLKVYDTTTTNLNVSTPGADIDTIVVTTDNGKEYYPTQVIASNILDGGLGINRHADVNNVTGAPDDRYCSLGGLGAYVILKFDNPINYNVKSITIIELGSGHNGVDEPVRIFSGQYQEGPWFALGKGGGTYTINL